MLVSSILFNIEWVTRPTRSPLLMLIWESLPRIESLHHLEEDRIVWIESANEVFSTRIAWEITRQHGAKVDWYNVLWFLNHIPKHCFITWSVLMRKILTQSLLCELKSLQNSHWNSRETVNHLFFQCTFSSVVWREITRTICIQANALDRFQSSENGYEPLSREMRL